MKNTAMLLIGFGGPESEAGVRPFLDSVLEGIKISEKRYQEVLHHYEIIGWHSPYNSEVLKQKEALERHFASDGLNLPVFAGFRHVKPSFQDVFERIKANGIQKVVGFVLSPLRSYASFEKYQERVDRGKEAAGASGIEVAYTEAFYAHPLFIFAQASRIRETASKFPTGDKTFFLFSAHSIPEEMSRRSDYAGQFREICRLAAAAAGVEHWDLAYQSRSGNPRDPWLAPDVKDRIPEIAAKGFKNLVLVPAGFLCENVEIMYDLDVEAKQCASENGLCYFRTAAVWDHPDFMRMTAELVAQKMNVFA